MDFLKELFGDQALTFDQLSQAAHDKGFEVVNAAGGAYVPKATYDTVSGQLSEANKKLEGYDPEWKTKAEAAQQALETGRMEDAIKAGVRAAKARNVAAVVALLDRDKLKFAGGEVIGLDKQLAELQKGEDTAFLFEQEPARKTGMSHQNGGDGAADKKDAANDALRALFNRGG